MPDLHTDAIHAFWDSYDRRTLYRVIVALERVEHWAMDEEPELEPAMLELGRVIDFASDFDVAGYEEPLIRILASTKSSRAMRILQALDLAKPGSASQLLMYAEDHSKGDATAANAHIKLFLHVI